MTDLRLWTHKTSVTPSASNDFSKVIASHDSSVRVLGVCEDRCNLHGMTSLGSKRCLVAVDMTEAGGSSILLEVVGRKSVRSLSGSMFRDYESYGLTRILMIYASKDMLHNEGHLEAHVCSS